MLYIMHLYDIYQMYNDISNVHMIYSEFPFTLAAVFDHSGVIQICFQNLHIDWGTCWSDTLGYILQKIAHLIMVTEIPNRKTSRIIFRHVGCSGDQTQELRLILESKALYYSQFLWKNRAVWKKLWSSHASPFSVPFQAKSYVQSLKI